MAAEMYIDDQGLEVVSKTTADGAFWTWGRVDGSLAIVEPFYRCETAAQTAFCMQNPTNFFTDDDGETTFFIGGYAKARVVPGGAPVTYATLPLERDGRRYTATPSRFHDRDGNAFAMRNDNNGGVESLYMLPHGAEEWAYINDLPGNGGKLFFGLARDDGTIYAISGAIARDLYRLE